MPTLCSPPYFVSTTQRLSIPLFKFHITSFVHLFLTPLLFLYHGVCLYTRGLLLLFVFWYRYGCDYPALQQYLRGMRNHSAVTVRIPSPHPPCRVSHTYSSTSVLPHLYHYLDEGDACCNKVGGWPNKVGGWPDGRIQRQKVCTTSHLSVFFFFFCSAFNSKRTLSYPNFALRVVFCGNPGLRHVFAHHAKTRSAPRRPWQQSQHESL